MWEAIGAIGGLAGALALALEAQGRLTRRQISHLPAEVRPVLMRVIDVCGQVTTRPRDRAWVEERVKPLQDQLEPICSHLASGNKAGSISRRSRDSDILNALNGKLGLMKSAAYDPDYPRDPAQAAVGASSHQDAASQALSLASAMLNRIDKHGQG